MHFSPEDEAFRAEVRGFLDEHLTEDMRRAVARQTGVFPEKDLAMRWQRILQERGWVAPSWPEEYGGPGWSPTQKYIWAEECARAGAPTVIPLGIRMLAPVLFRYGTEAQKTHYLPRILSGEDYWCQGYSEPGSGSDLSSLQTTAVRDGDDYVVNGTKIWTTHAHYADHIFCLVRTRSDGKPQEGITFLLIDMATPGVSHRPILTMAGDHEVNQVFFDDVRVPQANRVGEEHQGWTVAKYLLEFERGAVSAAPGLKVALEELKALARQPHASGAALWDDPDFRARVTGVEVGVRMLEFNELQTLEAMQQGRSPGAGSSIQKNASVDLEQQLETLSLELAGWYGVPHHNLLRQQDNNAPVIGPQAFEPAAARYLNGRAASIFGGSREVQKNILAKAVLGL